MVDPVKSKREQILQLATPARRDAGSCVWFHGAR
jgi:hypothetical protein